MRLATALCASAMLLVEPAAAEDSGRSAAPPHWDQLDREHRRSVAELLSDGYVLTAAFASSAGMEYAYLQKGGRLYRCLIGGGSFELLLVNELLCSEFVAPSRR